MATIDGYVGTAIGNNQWWGGQATPPIVVPQQFGWYDFDNSLLPDPSAISQVDAVINNGTFQTPAPQGTAYIDFATTSGAFSSLPFGANTAVNDVTITMWARQNSTGGSSGSQGLVYQNWDSSNDTRGISANPTRTGFIARGRDASGTFIFTPVILADVNEWHFIVFKQEGDVISIEVDGSAPETASGVGTKTFHRTVYLGSRVRVSDGFEDQYFNGGLDRIMVWNEALSQEQVDEVRSLYYM